MFKKIFLWLAIVWVAGASYVYYQSQQKPTDVYVATDVVEVPSENVMSVTMSGEVFSVSSWSVLWWRATKPGGFHTGTVVVSEWVLSVENGMVNSWLFTIDMTSVQLLDIDNEGFEAEIRDDFFQAPTYPTATFSITRTENQWSGLIIYGNLTIKEITQPISFPAEIIKDNDTVQFTAAFAIDRWLRELNMRENIVNDFLEFNFDLLLTKS